MNFGNQIVTDGLYLCLDAADAKSYSEGINLIDNGFGFSGNNSNFTNFTYDTGDKHGNSGSFLDSGTLNTRFSSNYIAVDTGSSYYLSAWVKAGNVNSGNYYSQNRQYFGIACYDADKNYISNEHCQKYASAVDTTLAQALNSGDSSIVLNSSVGWAPSGATASNRQIQWWPYTNNSGYTYPNYTYTRNTSRTNNFYASSGCWNNVSGNSLLLTQPWPGPNLTSGTAVANGSSAGGSYNYNVLSFVSIPNQWTFFSGQINNIDVDRNGTATEFRQGTAFVRLLFLTNYTSTPATPSDATIRYSDIIFRKSSSNTWIDRSKNKFNGSLRNSVVYDGSDKPSLSFNGIDDFIPLRSLTLGNTFTISAFINLSGNNVDTSIIGTDANGSDNWFGITNNKLYGRFTELADVNNSSLTGATTLSNLRWYFVAMTVNINTVKLYVNGVEDASGSVVWNIGAWNALFTLGRRSSIAQLYFYGDIATVQIYNRVLSASEIQKNFNSQRKRFNI
jgi:hypothetical protein